MLLKKLIWLFVGASDRVFEPRLDQATLNAKLKWAVFQGATIEVARLLRQGAQVNSAAPDGQTALHTAARHGRLELCRYLLRHGANANSARRDGQCALHIAAAHGSAELTRLLLSFGAQPARKDQRGRTAHDLAEAAALSQFSKSGMSKASWARWVRRKELASLLRDAELAAAVSDGRSIGDADPLLFGIRAASPLAWM